jgi:hypothetical protein
MKAVLKAILGHIMISVRLGEKAEVYLLADTNGNHTKPQSRQTFLATSITDARYLLYT